MTPVRRRPAAVIVVLLIVSLLPGCSLFDDDGGPRVGRVLVVGDSVTRLSEDEIRQELDWADTVDLRAHDGFRTDQLLVTTQDGISADPDIAIVMTGYNDVLQDTLDTGGLDDMVELVGRLPCAVWLLLPESGAGYPTEVARRWNDRLQADAADHPTIHLSEEWKAQVEGSPTFTYLSRVDAVHPNDEGQRAIAEAMAESADRECR